MNAKQNPAVDGRGLESVDAVTNNDSNMPKPEKNVNNNDLLTAALEYAARGRWLP